MRVSVVGAVGAVDGAGVAVDVGGMKQRTVLAVLAAHVGAFVSADRIAEAVWGDAIPDRAARSIATYVSNLRGSLGCDIESRQGSYRLVMPRSSIDLVAFMDAVDAAEAADESARSDLLAEALSSCSGVPFSGVEDHGVLRPVAVEYAERRLAAEKAVLDVEATSPSASTLSRLDVLVADHRHDEEVRALHIRALYAAGRHVDALASFRDYEQVLRDDLGLEPSQQLRDLELQVLEHKLEPGSDKNEIASSELVTPTAPPNLYASFVGRGVELDDLRARMEDHRLVTVVGAGGIGKSTLAAEVARDFQMQMSVAWISLETVPADELSMAIAQGVGLQPAGSVDPLDALVRYLETRPHLLVLDGCEASISHVTSIARGLLERSSSQILATSREPLGLVGESVVRIDPLPGDTAVELFMSRAELPGDVDEDALRAIEEVCAAVDGMPLAIELAAARARSLPVNRIADRMTAQIPLLKRPRTFDERHGSILAALDWSYNLLTPSEQETLRSTAVFRSPFTVDDVLDLLNRDDAEDDLARLVDTSMTRYLSESGNFHLLEPIRQYALHQAELEDEIAAIRNRHAELFARGAEEAARKEWTSETLEAWNWIFDRRADLHAATVWSADDGDGTAAIRICAGLGRRLVAVGIYPQFTGPFEQALKVNRGREDSVMIQAMVQLGWILWRDHRRPDEGVQLVEQALEMARRTQDQRSEAYALLRHAVIAYSDRDLEQILNEMDHAAAILEKIGDEAKTFQILNNQAVVLIANGRYDEAEDLGRRMIDYGNSIIGMGAWAGPGILAAAKEERGDLEAALELTMESATLSEEQFQYRHAEGYWIAVADLAERLGRIDTARHALERVRQINLLTGGASHQADVMAASISGEPAGVLGAAFAWTQSVKATFVDRPVLPHLDDDTIHGTVGNIPAIFHILVHVARALAAIGQTQQACDLAHSVPHLLETSNYPRWKERRELERWSDLLDNCPTEPPAEFTQLELEDLLDFVIDQTRPFASHRSNPTSEDRLSPR